MIKVHVIAASSTNFKYKGIKFEVPGVCCGNPVTIEVDNALEFLNLLDTINKQISEVIVRTIKDGIEYNLTIYNDYLE